jgi:hypothetical protein
LKDEWLKDSANPPDPIIVAEIVEDLQAAVAQFAEIATDLRGENWGRVSTFNIGSLEDSANLPDPDIIAAEIASAEASKQTLARNGCPQGADLTF